MNKNCFCWKLSYSDKCLQLRCQHQWPFVIKLASDHTMAISYLSHPGIILCMCPANERQRYIVTSSLIGCAHTQNDPCPPHNCWFLSVRWASPSSSTHLPPGQNGRHFADDIFKCIFVNEKFCISVQTSLKFVPRGPIDNNPALV